MVRKLELPTITATCPARGDARDELIKPDQTMVIFVCECGQTVIENTDVCNE